MGTLKGANEDDDSLFSNESAEDVTTYESLMASGGVESLSSRLKLFREWILKAGCHVHPAVCIVNGEATDGTKNAPVLVLGTSSSSNSQKKNAEGRCGTIDCDKDRELYDRTIGCQLRTTREIKENQDMMSIPRGIMITPDLLAVSDAGKAALACCQPMDSGSNFWDAFSNTPEKEKRFFDKIASCSGTQLLVKILQERKKVEAELAKAKEVVKEAEVKMGGRARRSKTKMMAEGANCMPEYNLAEKGTISSRAVVLCFLIHQRFSNHKGPRVSSGESLSSYGTKDDATKSVEKVPTPPGSPKTFAPYARTLPPSVPLPICWKRNELALLAGCIPGVPILQELAAQIMTLSSDFIALIKAGILHRFPSVFLPNLLTWDRWVWAASVHMSRILPASSYLNKGEEKARNHKVTKGEVFYSPPDIWDELGVMIPLLDMCNHESDASQILYEPLLAVSDEDKNLQTNEKSLNDDTASVAKVIIHKRVKKGSQIYTNYGVESNKKLMLCYGFGQINNLSDTVPIGWSLIDCIGNVPPPPDYISLDKTDVHSSEHEKFLVYESSDTEAINSWWTEDRLSLLEYEIRSDKTFWNLLRQGKKMTAKANSDGSYHPILLTAIVVATLPPESLRNHMKLSISSSENVKPPITITKKHQKIIRSYMLFLFSRKFEKLMQSFNNGLKAHFNNVKLWTKTINGGLSYNSSNGAEVSKDDAGATGWQMFFDSHAYTAAMEIEKRYYALAPDNCVLTLYDGYLRSLQASVDGVVSQMKFEGGALKQVKQLGFVITDTEETENVNDIVEDSIDSHKVDRSEDKDRKENGVDGKASEQIKEKSNLPKKQEKQDIGNGSSKNGANSGGRNNHEGERRERRRRQRRRNGPPAIKLHIGNLSFQTNPSALFDYFARRYGRDNVLECHIPTQRESGKSRGFGFVTMPELAAIRVLQADEVHEIDGRKVKIAESNTAGGNRGNHHNSVGVCVVPNDRCGNCGYRPKYCTCATPNLPPGFQTPIGGGPIPMMGGPPVHPPSMDDMYGPGPGLGPGLHGGGMDPYDQYHGRNNVHPDFDMRGGRRHSRSRNRGRSSYSRSPSPRYRGSSSRGDRSREGRYYDRNYRDRGRVRSYSRSRSRSYSRGRDRRGRRDRNRGRDSERGRDGKRRSRRSRGSSSRSDWRSASRYSRSRSRSLSRSRSQSYSKDTPSSSRRGSSGDRDRDRDRKSVAGVSSSNMDAAVRSQSRSASPSPQGREIEAGHKKRDVGKSRRSRSGSRSSRPRKRNKSSRRSKDVSKRHRSRSRSRSRSWKG